MLTKQLYKERQAFNAASDYLFGQKKVLTIGRASQWQTLFLKNALVLKKKKGFLRSLVDEILKAAELERQKQMLPLILFRLEPAGTQSPELTEEQYRNIFNP